MKLLLKAKSWHIFLLIMVGYFLMNFKIEGNLILTLVIYLSGFCLSFIWPLAVGHELQAYLPPRVSANYNFFVINFFIWFVAYIAIVILSDGEGMTFNGLAAIPGFYVVFALLYTLAFPAKMLKSIEKEGEVTFGEYFGDFLMVVLLPIGIWFLQPRINKVMGIHEVDSNKIL